MTKDLEECVVPGFRGELRPGEILHNTCPSEVRLLAEEPQSKDMSLAKMARRALNYLIHNPRKELDYECRFDISPLAYPPAPDAKTPDPGTIGDTDARIDWAFPLVREMCRELPDFRGDEGIETEEGLHRRLLGYLREDGLCWTIQLHGLPSSDPTSLEEAGSPWTTGKLIMSCLERYRLTGDEKHRRLAESMVAALKRLASWETGRAYYAGGQGAWREGKWFRTDWSTYHPTILHAIVRYWEITGDEEALEFARAMADGILANLQTTLGSHRVQADGSFIGHMHMECHGIWGVAAVGVATGEPRFVEWVRRAFEYVRSQSTDYGWVPEFTAEDQKYGGWSELCAVNDTISIAACLAKAGYPAYFDYVERAIRNYVRQSQFFITPRYESLYRAIHGQHPERVEEGLKMMRDFEGGFIAVIRPNDALMAPNVLNMGGCCQPEGMRALHTAWANVLTESREGVFVNMSFNREAPQAQVVSFLPEQGRLTVVVKQAHDFFLRPPTFTPRQQVLAFRHGRRVEPIWLGDYIKFPKAHQGEELTITYPLVKFTQKAIVGPQAKRNTFEVTWRGNTVIDIKPEGQYYPLFSASSEQ